MKRVLAAVLTLSLIGCSSEPVAPVTSTACAWVQRIRVPDRERALIIREAPVTAQAIGDHNAAVIAACP